MFHITFYHVWRRVAGIDVHGNNILSVIDDTQMTMMVLVHATFVDLAQVQDIHHTKINRCKNNVFRPVVLRKQYLDFLTKGFKVMFDLVILKDYLLLFIIHSSLKDQRFHFKFIFFFQFTPSKMDFPVVFYSDPFYKKMPHKSTDLKSAAVQHYLTSFQKHVLIDIERIH